jgi:hypothetical protein
MTQETYENLMRVIEKRKRQARITGDWHAYRAASEEAIRLQSQFHSCRP